MNLILLRSQANGQVKFGLARGKGLKKILLVSNLLSLLLLAGSLQLSARDFTNEELLSGSFFFPVNGIIKNDKNEPLAGVTVTVKGSKNSVVTSQDGSFTIDAEKGNMLLISSVGYKPTAVKVGSQGSLISVTLELADGSLDEVVVVG
jgi:hypothetical protein